MDRIAYVGHVADSDDDAMLLDTVVEEGLRSIYSEGELSEQQLLIFDYVFLDVVVCTVFSERKTIKVSQRATNCLPLPIVFKN